MANCKVQYNADRTIARVLDENGQESKLFKQIAHLPHIGSLEEALEVYKNKYAGGVLDSEVIPTQQEGEGGKLLKVVVDKIVKLRDEVTNAETPEQAEQAKEEFRKYLTKTEGLITSAMEKQGLLYKKDC